MWMKRSVMLARDKRGFSLVEILVALVIISFVVLGFTAATITVIQSNEISQNYTVATTLAQDIVETLKSGTLALADGSGCNLPTTGFTCSWTVTANSPLAGVTEVAVTISWNDYQARSVIVNTVINN